MYNVMIVFVINQRLQRTIISANVVSHRLYQSILVRRFCYLSKNTWVSCAMLFVVFYINGFEGIREMVDAPGEVFSWCELASLQKGFTKYDPRRSLLININRRQ